MLNRIVSIVNRIDKYVNNRYSDLYSVVLFLAFSNYFICNNIFGDDLENFYRIFFIIISIERLISFLLIRQKIKSGFLKTTSLAASILIFYDIVDRFIFKIRVFVYSDYLLLAVVLLLSLLVYVGKYKGKYRSGN